ncbi:MAG TPA: hypothetical protein VGE68_04730 [Sphingomicrobium sp.]
MTIMTKMMAGAATVAALATAAPAAAQYYSPRYANPYGYSQPYGNAYGYYGNSYGYNANATNMAAQQCTAAVQSRLNNRVTMGSILGAVFGARTSGGQVLQVTRVDPNRGTVRVRGLASSGSNYSPYGYGAYGALGYGARADLSFKCDVDYNGYIRDVDINRR